MGMDDLEPAGQVLPNPRIPKVMGILNIVFASGLILFGICMGAYIALLPLLSKGMVQMQKKAEADLRKEQEVQLKELDEAEKAVVAEAEKEALKEQRKTLEARPQVAMPMTMDFDKLGMNTPRVRAYYWTEIVTGLLLNVLMIVSGIGMVRRKLWGINLGIYTAAAKLARLLLVYSFFALAVVPPLAEGSGKMAGEMMIQQQKAMGRPVPKGLDPAYMTKVYYVTYTLTAVAMIVFGSIYPAISLWLLTRPGAKAACDEKAPPGFELNEAW
jgi:hypothetical protein